MRALKLLNLRRSASQDSRERSAITTDIEAGPFSSPANTACLPLDNITKGLGRATAWGHRPASQPFQPCGIKAVEAGKARVRIRPLARQRAQIARRGDEPFEARNFAGCNGLARDPPVLCEGG